MARFVKIEDVPDNTEFEPLVCTNCESTQFTLIADNIVECSVCKSMKSV